MNDSPFKALADPTRRKILHLLQKSEMTAGEIASHFAISGPSMSHHFSALKNAELILARKEGQQVIFSLNTTVVQDVIASLLDLVQAQQIGDQNEN
jgi:DNA-binding transcriptional ArsR family regulator